MISAFFTIVEFISETALETVFSEMDKLEIIYVLWKILRRTRDEGFKDFFASNLQKKFVRTLGKNSWLARHRNYFCFCIRQYFS